MKHEESMGTQDGIQLYAQAWKPEGLAKGVITLIHGLGEHSGRYTHVAQAFTDAGYVVYSFDLPGHGKSGGVRGHASYEQIMKLIDNKLGETGQQYPGLPRFLYGHSLGGSLVLYYLYTRKPAFLSGAVVTSPGLETGEPVPAWKKTLAQVMSKLNPSMVMTNGLDVHNLSHDPAVEKAYNADPLVHNKISTGLGWDLMSNGQTMLTHADQFPLVPMLIMQGSADHLVNPQATQKLASQLKGDITFKAWEGLYHETHNEPQKGEVIETMIAWLNQHL